MLRLIAPLAVAAALLAACTTIHRVPRPSTVEELHEITGRDPGAAPGLEERHLLTASVLFQPTDGSRDLVSVPRNRALAAIDGGGAAYDSSLLRGYEVKRTGTGVLEGLGIGVLSGILAGGLIGAGLGNWTPQSTCHGECDGLPGEYTMFGGRPSHSP